MFDDRQSGLYQQFLQSRKQHLWNRFPGYNRAIVVETNDPLRIHRVRFKCPEMHNWDLPVEDCPWAVPAPSMGGKRAGSWVSPCIGDIVWITFDKGHPYAPIWTAGADPTRRKFYPLPAIYGTTPLPVDEKGNPAEKPDDEPPYLPSDFRPMSYGTLDRYGNLDMASAVGYYPTEHEEPPPDPGHDAIQSFEAGLNGEEQSKTPFSQSTQKPKVNDPDLKYMLRMSKYGHFLLLGDQGYHWKKEDTGELGEFTGDFDKDEKWEVKRWRDIQAMMNEGSDKEDQRRILLQSRYGTKVEIRDVGWNKSREGEYGERRKLSSTDKDERWFKVRTKGGFVFQMIDIGFDDEEDEFVKRPLVEETGVKTEHEDELPEDARMARLVSRYGFKFVIDDSGSHTKKAEEKENPRGRGMLWKTRRTAGSDGEEVEGYERGFFLEFSEKDELNQTTWGTPSGITVQMSDKQQYFLLASRIEDYSKPWMKFKENEFLDSSLIEQDALTTSHHFLVDHKNEFIRLKSRSGSGSKSLGKTVETVSGEHQGLEIRDLKDSDSPWVELVDANKRGLWFWGKGGFTVCRARRSPKPVDLSWWLGEKKKEIVVFNEEPYVYPPGSAVPSLRPRIQIYCKSDVEIIAEENVNVHSFKKATVRSDQGVVLFGGGTGLEVKAGAINCTQKVYAPDFVKSQPAVIPLPAPDQAYKPQIEPTDRGKRPVDGSESKTTTE